MSDEHIDYSEVPELPNDFFERARKVAPVVKQKITLRVSPSTLQTIKDEAASRGTKCQTMLSNVLDLFAEHIRASR